MSKRGERKGRREGGGREENTLKLDQHCEDCLEFVSELLADRSLLLLLFNTSQL